MMLPPSTAKACPVINSASGLARYPTILAISVGVTVLPRGIPSMNSLRFSPKGFPFIEDIFLSISSHIPVVPTTPGAYALTLILYCANSLAAACLN